MDSFKFCSIYFPKIESSEPTFRSWCFPAKPTQRKTTSMTEESEEMLQGTFHQTLLHFGLFQVTIATGLTSPELTLSPTPGYYGLDLT